MPKKDFLSSPRERKQTRDNTKGILSSKHARISEAKRNKSNMNKQKDNNKSKENTNKNK